jgi:hypothetical protein
MQVWQAKDLLRKNAQFVSSQSARVESRQGGIHPHCDRKSPEAFEYKGVARRLLRKRVRKRLEAKKLDEERMVDEG